MELTHLIALTQRKRAEAEKRGMREMSSVQAWQEEFSTIRIGSTRQSGHSTAIARALKLFETPLVIVPYQAQAENIERLDNYGHVTSALGFLNGNFRGCEIDAIFVDCASHIDLVIREGKEERLQNFWVDAYAHLERMNGLLILVG